MAALGDFDASTVVYGKFTTYRPSTGAALTLGGTPALSVYKDNSTTQSTTGVTLTADFDTVTGLNHFAIDTSADGTFYSAGSFFDIVITTGTVDGVSVVGAVVASFTIRKTSAIKPTTAGRTLDVSAGGEAGVDWANVGSPTTAVNLSGTTVKTATDVETDTADIQSRLPAALVSGRIDASVGAMASGVLTATAIAADAITDAKVASDVTIASVTGSVGSVTGAVGSVTGNVGGNVVGSVGSVVATVDANLVEILGAVDVAMNFNDCFDMTSDQGGINANLNGNIFGSLTGSIGEVALGAITATSFTAGAIDASAIATDAIGALELAAGAASEIATAVRTELTTELGRIDVAVSTRASQTSLDTLDDYVDTEVAAIKAVTDKVDNTLTLTSDGYVFNSVALQQVWDEQLAGHLISGSTGAALNAAGSAGDPWITALPGGYTAGQAGYILGTNLNATVSSRATQTSVDAIDAVTDKIDTTLFATSDGYAFTANALEFAPTGGLDAAGVRAAVGLASANLDTQLSGINAKTTNLPSDPADESLIIAATDALSALIGSPAGASVSADIAAVKAQTAAIETDTQDIQGRLPAALVNGQIDSTNSDTVVLATVGTGSTTTSIVTSAFSPAGAVADQFKGRIVIFNNDTATAALRGQGTLIDASSNSSTPTLTVVALTTAPSSGDVFTVV